MFKTDVRFVLSNVTHSFFSQDKTCRDNMKQNKMKHQKQAREYVGVSLFLSLRRNTRESARAHRTPFPINKPQNGENEVPCVRHLALIRRRHKYQRSANRPVPVAARPKA